MSNWFTRNWKTIATVALSTAVFAAVTVATGGLGAPVLLAMAAGGFASGVVGYGAGQLLEGKPVRVKDALIAGGVSTVISVGTLGVGRVVAPLLSRAAPVVPQAVVRAAAKVPVAVRVPAVNTAVGATLGAALHPEDRLNGATVGAATGLLQSPAQRVGQALVANRLAAQRQQLMTMAHRRYEESLKLENDKMRAAAEENYNHVKRLLAAVDENEGAIRAMGYDPARERLKLIYSDTHKDAASVDALARRLFPDYDAKPGESFLKALLLHEEPAIALFRQNARQVGLPRRETELVVDGIRGHNGPATPGSWWGDTWERLIAHHPRLPGSELLGRPYPQPSRESALATFLDRHDSRLGIDAATGQYKGGPVKFLAEGVGRKEPLQKAWDNATEVAYDGTLGQLAELRRLQPALFESEFVRRGLDQLGLTVAVRSRVSFPEPNVAIVDGRVRVTEPAALWRALAAGDAPPAPQSKGFAAALQAK